MSDLAVVRRIVSYLASHRPVAMLSLLLLASATMAMSPDTIKAIQQQSALLAESSLSSKMNPCLLNRYCMVATTPEGRITKDSIAAGLALSFEVIDKVIEHSEGHTLPNLMKIKDAFELGRETSNAALCEKVFRCGKELNIPTESEVMARAAVPDCDALDGVCPGLSIGCGLCGGALPGVCGPLCPLAALFCGSSGYFCALGAMGKP